MRPWSDFCSHQLSKLLAVSKEEVQVSDLHCNSSRLLLTLVLQCSLRPLPSCLAALLDFSAAPCRCLFSATQWTNLKNNSASSLPSHPMLPRIPFPDSTLKNTCPCGALFCPPPPSSHQQDCLSPFSSSSAKKYSVSPWARPFSADIRGSVK